MISTTTRLFENKNVIFREPIFLKKRLVSSEACLESHSVSRVRALCSSTRVGGIPLNGDCMRTIINDFDNDKGSHAKRVRVPSERDDPKSFANASYVVVGNIISLISLVCISYWIKRPAKYIRRARVTCSLHTNAPIRASVPEVSACVRVFWERRKINANPLVRVYTVRGYVSSS